MRAVAVTALRTDSLVLGSRVAAIADDSSRHSSVAATCCLFALDGDRSDDGTVDDWVHKASVVRDAHLEALKVAHRHTRRPF